MAKGVGFHDQGLVVQGADMQQSSVSSRHTVKSLSANKISTPVNTFIYLIAIYPLHKLICFLNNWDQIK